MNDIVLIRGIGMAITRTKQWPVHFVHFHLATAILTGLWTDIPTAASLLILAQPERRETPCLALDLPIVCRRDRCEPKYY